MWGHDFQYLRSITTPNRLLQMLQRIGSEFFLDKAQKKNKILDQFLKLSWTETQHISTFIKQYDQAIRICKEVGLFSHTEEQRSFFNYKISLDRRENFAVFNGLNKLNSLPDTDSLMSYMMTFSNVIVTKYPAGIVPKETDNIMSQPTISQTKKIPTPSHYKKDWVDLTCYERGEAFPHA